MAGRGLSWRATGRRRDRHNRHNPSLRLSSRRSFPYWPSSLRRQGLRRDRLTPGHTGPREPWSTAALGSTILGGRLKLPGSQLPPELERTTDLIALNRCTYLAAGREGSFDIDLQGDQPLRWRGGFPFLGRPGGSVTCGAQALRERRRLYSQAKKPRCKKPSTKPQPKPTSTPGQLTE